MWGEIGDPIIDQDGKIAAVVVNVGMIGDDLQPAPSNEKLQTF
ncbi:MAG: hypothetical protein WD623_17330 [Marinobacter sp.]